MPSTDVDVCNMALAHLGDRRIDRLDQDAQTLDPLSRYCADFYDQTRREVLSAMRWTFAESDAVLVQVLGGENIGQFGYIHTLPTDCLRLMDVLTASAFDSNGDPTYYQDRIDQFKKVGNTIKSNYEHVAVQYIADVTDITQWDQHAIAALARKLAHYLAGPVADSPALADRMLDLYEKVDLPNAQYYDAVQDKSNENSQLATRRANSPIIQERLSTGYGQGEPLDG
jgi:hypothetical protein